MRSVANFRRFVRERNSLNKILKFHIKQGQIMSKEISFLKVAKVTETMAPDVKFPPEKQFEVKLENNDHYAVITVRDNKKWRIYILDQLLQLWTDNLESAHFVNEREQGGGRGRGQRGGRGRGGRGRPTEERILQQFLRDSDKDLWDSQKAKWTQYNVTVGKFEDLIKKVKKDLLGDFKYIDMCWDYFLLTYQQGEIISLRDEMDMCKNNCNVHVKIHFKNSGKEMRDLLTLSSSDGSSCLTILKQTLPTITTKIQEIYPEEGIFVFIPLAVMSTFHDSKNAPKSYDTTYHQDVIDQADQIWLELKTQYYEFFMDFIHSRTDESIQHVANTCPVFVTRKNPFLVQFKKPK